MGEELMTIVVPFNSDVFKFERDSKSRLKISINSTRSLHLECLRPSPRFGGQQSFMSSSCLSKQMIIDQSRLY
jgi:hypothetical protein